MLVGPAIWLMMWLDLNVFLLIFNRFGNTVEFFRGGDTWKFVVKLLVIGLGSVVLSECILNHASSELHFILEHLKEIKLEVKFGETNVYQ